MKLFKQTPKPDRGFQPSPDASSKKGLLSAARKTSAPWRLLLLLAALALLGLGAPAAFADEKDQSPPGCTGSTLGINLFTDAPDVHVGDTLHYSVTIFNGLPGSPRISCDATSIQAWIVTPDGKTNIVNLTRTTLLGQQSDYYTNAATYVVRAQDILPDGTVRATANDTGIIHQNVVNSTGGGFQGVNTQVSQPCVKLLVSCLGSIGENGIINFSGTVTNCGNDTLVGVTVTNFDNNGFFSVNFVTNLLQGQIATFTGSWVPLNPCGPNTVTLVAQAVDQFTTYPRTVTSSGTVSCANTLTPGILVTKSCPATPVAPGQLLVFSGSVSNTGNITLTNIVIVDNQPAANTPVFTLASLAPGAVATFTGSYPAPNNCSVSDTLTARAASVCGVPVTNSASATCSILTTPAIQVTQSCPAAPVVQGGILTYTGTVKNIGDTVLTNIMVFNNRSGSAPVFTLAILAPGASANFTGSYVTLTNCCVDSSTVTASGQGCSGLTGSDTATRTCVMLTSPALTVTKVCAPGLLQPGDLLSYHGTVSNSGNITLINVIVVSSQPGNGSPVLGPIDLVPGQTANYTVSYIVPEDFCGNDTVTASGTDLCTSLKVSNSVTSTCPLLTMPRISVTKNCPATPTPRGGLYTFTGTVTNTGNVTLVNVTVVDSQPTNNTPVFGPVTLAPGASANFTGSYIAPLCCCDIIDTLTASGQDRCSGTNVSNTASQACPLLSTPAITVTEICPATPIPMGSVFVFNGSVSNSGDVVLTNVYVFGPPASNNHPVLGPIELAPGESETFTGSYLVPFDSCFVTVTGTGRQTCGAGGAVTNVFSCPVAVTPLVLLTQNCPATPAVPGVPLTYSGSVSNAGNITLVNIAVVNNYSGTTPVFTAASLAPGAAVNYTGTFTAPEDCAATIISRVSATTICGVPVGNAISSTCPILTSAAIAVTKACLPGPVTPGGSQGFIGTVTNIGNITLTNVFVVDNQPAPHTLVLGPMSLAPGAGTNFAGSYILMGLTNLSTNVVTLFTTNTISVVTTNSSLLVTTNTVITLSTNLVTTLTTNLSQRITTNLLTTITTNQVGSLTTNLVTTITTNQVGVLTTNLVTTLTTNSVGSLTTNLVQILTTNSVGTVLTNFVTTFVTNTVAILSTNHVTTLATNTVTTFVTNSVGTVVTNLVTTFTTNTAAILTTNFITVTVTNNSGSVIVTNNTVTVVTNTPTPFFGTINPVSKTVVDRFVVPSGLEGLTYADQDEGYAATQFYTTRKDNSGTSFFDTITTGTHAVTDRFAATSDNFDSLAFAAPDLGYGPVIFYYLRHDSAGVSTFGTISPGGAVGVVADHFVVGNNFDSLTFSATDVGYGANLFYYVRHDATGLSTFGTINPALPGTVTDRFTVGTNVDALVFTSTDVGAGYGVDDFYYLRHDSAGISTFGTIFVTGLTTATVTDRFVVGTNASELAFTPTDVGFGPNLFYFLREGDVNLLTNTVTTLTTNSVPVVTTNTVPVITTNTIPVVTTNTVPVVTTNTVPVVITNTVPVITTNNVVVVTTNSLPVITTNSIPVVTTNTVPVVTTNTIPVITTNTVPVITTNSIPVITTNTVPVLTTNSVPVVTTNTIPVVTTNSVPVFTTNNVPVVTTNTVPVVTSHTGTITTTNTVVSLATNAVLVVTPDTVTTITTNVVPGIPSDTVTASGTDVCQSRTVTATASCSGAVKPVPPVIGGPGVAPPNYSHGAFAFSFGTQAGVSYLVQYKNTLSDPAWIDLPGMPLAGTGGVLTVTDAAGGAPVRFYRVITAP